MFLSELKCLVTILAMYFDARYLKKNIKEKNYASSKMTEWQVAAKINTTTFLVLHKLELQIGCNTAAVSLFGMLHSSAWPVNNQYALVHSSPNAAIQWTGTWANEIPTGHTVNKLPNITCKLTNNKKRIRKQLYMSCRGFSSAQRRAWTNSWMKLTCKLWTKARPSASAK